MYNPLLNPQSTSIIKWMVRKGHPFLYLTPCKLTESNFNWFHVYISASTQCLILLSNHTLVQIGLTATLNQPLVERCKTDLGAPFW